MTEAVADKPQQGDHILCYLDDIKKAIEPIHPRYRQWVERDDLVQELLVWVINNEAKARDLKAENRWYLLRRLRTVAERYARKQKAAISGYDVADEYYYSLPQLLTLLPAALEPTSTPPQRPADEATGQAGGTVDLADWAVAVADVRQGLGGIGYQHYRTFTTYHAGTNVNPDDLRKALVALQRKLGGRKPR